MRTILLFLAILAFAAFPPRADSVQIQSINSRSQGDGTGFFTGNLVYTYSGGTSATLMIQLNNTSAVNSAGRDVFTGFVLNNPRGRITGATLSSFSNPSFALLFSYRNVPGQPWGNFDLGATLGP